jgi:hypothetical protein
LPVVIFGVLGTLAVIAYAVFAEIQILVLNPLAAVPNESLEAIWARMSPPGAIDRQLTTGILSVGVILAVVLLAGSLLSLRGRPRAVAAGFLGLLVLGAPAYVLASFSPGLNLADTFGVDGADYSPWANVLYAASAVALVGLVILGALSGAGPFRSWAVSTAIWVPGGCSSGCVSWSPGPREPSRSPGWSGSPEAARS